MRSAARATVFALWCGVGALWMLTVRAVAPARAMGSARVIHRGVRRLFSLDCEYIGHPVTDRTVLYVANHTSYLDVFVLGAVLRGVFVAKSEVASWPVFGAMARLQNTLFLERRPRFAGTQVDTLRAHLAAGHNAIVFPEGTSTVGTYVAPFRSSLFEAARDVVVQPITVAYVGRDGAPLTAAERDRFAWYLPDPERAPNTPNQPFLKHFLGALGLPGCTVRVLFHPPIAMPVEGRKALARRSEACVRSGLEKLLSADAIQEQETHAGAAPQST